MRTTPALSALTLVLVCAFLAPASGALEVYGVAPIHKITPLEEPTGAWKPGSVAIESAGNESESFQIVLRSDEALQDIALELGDLRSDDGAVLPVDQMRPCKVEWVDVNAPYDVNEPSENPDLRPDPLHPVDPATDRFAIEPGNNLVLWLSIAVPENTSPEVYTGQVRFLVNATPVASLEVQLRVRGFSLPRKPILESMIGMASANIYKAHGCKTPEDQEAIIRLYFDEYIRARLSPFLYATGTIAFNPLPDGRINWEFALDADGKPTGEATVDFTVFDREGEHYFNERQAFSAFNFAPYLWTRVERDGKKDMVLRIADVKGTAIEGTLPDGSVNPVFDQLVVSVFRQIAAHLSEKGWLERAIYYVTDEPGEGDTDALKRICLLVREADPRIRTALTYDPANRPRLAELVEDGKSLISVWIPYCSQYREDVAADQRSKGAEYWLYDVKQNCLISHSGRKNRAMFWETWHRDANGYLYYLSTYWGRDATPWDRPSFLLPNVTYQYRLGDGYFFYPPLKTYDPEEPILDHVVTTIRWELMREGAEDYDYLRMLADLTDQAQARGLAAATKGREALDRAHDLAERLASATSSYGIRDLQFEAKPGWGFSREEGWLSHTGSERSDLPIQIATALPDGRYQLVLEVYDDNDYRGKPRSRFLVNGTQFSTPGSNLKGSTSVAAGTVEVRDGVAAFTLSSVEEDWGVIVYRAGLKSLTDKASDDLYAARAQVAEAIEALTTALAGK